MSEKPPDDLFWSPDPLAALEKAFPPRPGLELLAPMKVDLGARQTLPAVLRRTGQMREDAAAPLRRFGALVAFDPARDQVFTGVAQAPHEDQGVFRAPDAKTLARMISAVTTRGLVVDLRTAVVLPWRPAELTVMGVARELRSEPVHVVLQGSDAGGPPGPGERELEVVSHEKTRLSPALPALPGIALAVDAKRSLLHGSYRLPGGGSIHLVFCGHSFPRPTVRRLRVQGAEGHFTVDPGSAGLGSQQAYTVWAMARDVVGGPAQVPPVAPR